MATFDIYVGTSKQGKVEDAESHEEALEEARERYAGHRNLVTVNKVSD